jgi:Zn-dependent protease
MDQETLRTLVVVVPGILIAITYHEAAHGWMADRLGDPTARMLGRLSLNPIKHVDPFGTVILPLLMFLAHGPIFGYAKPVPVSIRNLRRPRRDMALVAAAGPATNVLLAVVAAVLFRILAPLAGEEGFAKIVVLPVALLLQYLVIINVVLTVFNLIPIPPLDGGRILVGLLPPAQAMKVERIERYGILILMGVMVVNPLGIWTGVFSRLVGAAAGLLLG